jgi:hypothetical protein
MPGLVKGYSYPYKVGLKQILSGFLLRQIVIF